MPLQKSHGYEQLLSGLEEELRDHAIHPNMCQTTIGRVMRRVRERLTSRAAHKFTDAAGPPAEPECAIREEF